MYNLPNLVVSLINFMKTKSNSLQLEEGKWVVKEKEDQDIEIEAFEKET